MRVEVLFRKSQDEQSELIQSKRLSLTQTKHKMRKGLTIELQILSF